MCTLGISAENIKAFRKKACSSTFLPVLQTLFELPGQGPNEGTPNWLALMAQRIDKVEFIFLLDHPVLLKKFIEEEVASDRTDKNGFPILLAGETVPDGPYENIVNGDRLPTFHPSKSYKSVPRLPFIRKVSHTRAIRALKEAGLEPFDMDPKTTPDKKRWNNFARVLLTYWVHYCVSEGISRFDDQARRILLFLFKGI